MCSRLLYPRYEPTVTHMNVINTTDIVDKARTAGFKQGVDHALTDLNDLMFDPVFTPEERQVIERAFYILYNIHLDVKSK
jgi:hypothetical protein